MRDHIWEREGEVKGLFWVFPFRFLVLEGMFTLTRHDHGTVILGLLDGVVPAPFPVVVAGLEHREFEVEVCVEGKDDREGREEDIRDERGHHGGEGLGNAGDRGGRGCGSRAD